MNAIAEENPYQSNFAQNMKANTALREQLLKNMDCDTQPSTPTADVIPTLEICDEDDDGEDDNDEVEEQEEEDDDIEVCIVGKFLESKQAIM